MIRLTASPQTLYLQDEAATVALAESLCAHLLPGAVLYLSGELGAGKTTLTRAMLRHLGVTERVKSPSYTLVESYALPLFTLFHFDCYRLTHPQALMEIGLEDYFTPESVCIIEWPEKAEAVLPRPTLQVTLTHVGDGREATINLLPTKE